MIKNSPPQRSGACFLYMESEMMRAPVSLTKITKERVKKNVKKKNSASLFDLQKYIPESKTRALLFF